MTAMDINALENQLIELQMQVAFQDDTVQALNDMVGKQQQDILSLQSQMQRLLSELKMVLAELEQAGPNTASLIEKPPHY